MVDWSAQSISVLGSLHQIYTTTKQSENEHKQGASNAENKENVTIVWLDPYCLNEKILTKREKTIRAVNHHILFYADIDECISRIEMIKKEKILFIVTSKCVTSVLPRLEKIRQVDGVLIFSSFANSCHYKNIPNTLGVFTKYSDLVTALRHHITIVNRQLHLFSFYRSYQRYVRNLSSQSASYLWFHVFHNTILHLPNSDTAQKEMLDAARQYYRGNKPELQRIDVFEKTYRSADAIKWYTKNSFVYRLVNKALRTEDVEQLYTFRYFIRDICTALSVEHNAIKQLGDPVTVYRGVRLTQFEFDNLVRDSKQLVSMNGFLSTSLTREVAEMYAGKPTADKLSVVIEITCDVEKLGDSIVFAFIGASSHFKDENEVLFDIGSTFRFEGSAQDESTGVWHLKMVATDEGLATLQSYMQDILREATATSPDIAYGVLLYNMGKYLSSASYFEQLMASSEDKDAALIHVHLGRALGAQGLHEKEWMHYEYAHKLLINAEVPENNMIASTLVQMGLYCLNADKISQALEYLNRALEMLEQVFGSGNSRLASILRHIGSCHRVNGDYVEASKAYTRAAQNLEHCQNANYINTCEDLLEIGDFYRYQRKYDKALNYFQRALHIRMEMLPIEHADIADCLLLIGEIFNDQSHPLAALLCLKKAWKMYKKLLPPYELVQKSAVLHGIGTAYYTFASFEQALEYYRRSWKMKKKYHPSN